MKALPGYTASAATLLDEPFDWVRDWELLAEAEAEETERQMERR